MAVQELDRFRQQYPQYNDLDDQTLATRLASKYPQYADLPQRVQQESGVSGRTPPLESDFAKVLFPSAGGTLGGVAGTALGSAAGGIGAAPGGFVGATTGAGAGESLRQLLSGFLGGPKPQTVLEASVKPVQQAALEATGMGVGRAVPALGRALRQAIPPTVARIGQLITRVSSEAIRRAMERGPGRVLRKELVQKMLPESIVERFTSGLNAFRDQAEQAYDEGLKEAAGLMAAVRVNINRATQTFQDRLVKMKILDAQGRTIKPILPAANQATLATRKLQSIFRQLQQLQRARGIGGKPRGGFLSAEDAIRLKRDLDTMLEFKPGEVREIPTGFQGAVRALRTSIKDELNEVMPSLKDLNEEYHTFRELYDTVQPRLAEGRIESTIQGLASRRGTFTFKKLAEINEQLDPDLQFLNEGLDALAAQEFAKDPELFAILPLSIGGAFAGGPFGFLGRLGGVMLGAQLASPRSLAAMLRGGERFLTEPATRASAALAPLVPAARQVAGPSISALLRTLGLPEE